jgi:hypothetical protein
VTRPLSVAAPRLALLLALQCCACAGCAAPSATPTEADSSEAPPPDPAPLTEWHQEPVVDKAIGRHVVVYNHSNPSLELATVALQLDQQYDWLAEWCGFAPRWVFVHVGDRYPCGMSIRAGEVPEMFLQAPAIFDTAANYAHEMTHCFAYELGGAIPHWFNESLADMAYVDAEIALWRRRREAPWFPMFDRIDWRSYELLQLRKAHGAAYFPKVMRALWRRRDECRATFSDATKLDEKNGLLVAALSEAAGSDVLPRLKELGFDVRSRERQRGY